MLQSTLIILTSSCFGGARPLPRVSCGGCVNSAAVDPAIAPGIGDDSFGGFLFMMFSNGFIRYRIGKDNLAFGIVPAEGIGIHSKDSRRRSSGNRSCCPCICRKVDSAYGVYGCGREKRTAALYALLIASLETPPGAFVACPFVGALSDTGLGHDGIFAGGIDVHLGVASFPRSY